MKVTRTTRSILLTAALAALAIGLVVTTGARLDRDTEKDIVTRFSQRQLLLAEQTATGIQSVFDKAQQYLLHFKDAPGPTHLTDALGAEDEEGIATWRGVTGQGFSGCLRSHPNYTQIRYIDAGGQEIVVVDSDGETVRVVPQDELRSQAEREFFIATQQLDEGEIYVSPLEPALGHGEMGAGLLAVRLTTPIFDSQGRRAGIIVINLLADEIRAHVARLTIEEGVDAWVLDETGVEIINVAHPELEGSNAYKYCQQTGDETLIALTEDMLAGRRGTGIYLWPESEGGPLVLKKLIAYTPIHLVEGHLWSLGISESYDSILAAHRQTHTMLLFLGGSIIAIVLAGAVLAAQSHRKQAVAEERTRLSETLRRRGEELEALQEISLAITAQLELDKLLENIVEQGCRLLDVSAGGIYLVDETRGDLEYIVSHGYTRDYTGMRLAPGEGLSGRVLRSGAPLVVNDYHHWEGRATNWGTEPLTGCLGVPLKHGVQVIGVLTFDEITRDRKFDEHDLWLATLFASQTVIAIENARLYQAAQKEIAERKRAEEKLKESEQRLKIKLDRILSPDEEIGDFKLTDIIDIETLQQIQDAFAQANDVASIILDLDANPITEESNYCELCYLIRQTAKGKASCRESGVVLGEKVAETIEFAWHACSSCGLLEACAPIVVAGKHVANWFIGQSNALDASRERIRDYAEEVGADVDAVLAAFNKMPDMPIEKFEQILSLLWQVALELSASAYNNLKLAKAVNMRKQTEMELRRRNQHLSALQAIAATVSRSLDLDEILHDALDKVLEVTRLKVAGIQLLDESGKRLLLQAHRGLSETLRQSIAEVQVADDPLFERLLASGEPLVGAMAEVEKRFKAEADAEGLGSYVISPLRSSDRILGLMVVQSRGYREFATEEVALLAAIGDQIGLAIQNARLYQAEQSSRERADTLRDVSRAVSSTLELDDVLSLVLRQAKRVLTYDTASILLFSGGEPAMAAVSGYEDEKLVRTEVSWRPNDSPILQAIARDHRAVVIADVREDERWIWVPGAENIRAWIGAPLLARDEMIGALMIDSAQPGFYTAADVAIAQALANQAAVAIENARLYQESHDRAEEQKGLARIAALASSTLEIDELIEQIMGETMRMLGSRGGMLLLLDEERDALTARYLRSPHLTEEIKASWRIPIETPGFENSIFARGGSYLCNDVEGDPDVIPVYRPHLRILKVGNFAGVALRLKDRSIGELYVGDRPADFGPKDTRLLRTIAGYVANAIENARLYEQAQHRLESLSNLNRASQVITSSLDVKQVLEQIVNLAGPIVNSDYTSVVLLDEEGQPVLGIEDFRGVPTIVRRIRRGGVARHVLDSGQPVVVDTVSDEGAMSPPLWQPDGELMNANPDVVAAGIRSFAAVPIQAKGRTLGVAFVHSRQPRAFRGQIPLLTTFANQAAVAIENARLFEAERQQRVQAEALRETGIIVSSALDLGEVLERLLEQVERIVPSDSSNVMLIKNNETRIAHQRGYERFGVADEMARLALDVQGTANLRWMVETGQPCIISDARADPNWAPTGAGSHVRSYVGVPIIVGDKVIGCLSLDKTKVGFYRQEHAKMLTTFARQAAVAIENARLFEAEQRRRQEAETLRETALALTTSLDRNQVIERILIQLQQVVPYDSASVQLLRGDYLELIGGRGFPNLEELLGVTFELAAKDSPNRKVILTRAPFILEDAPAVYDSFTRKPYVQTIIRSWLGAPMLIGDQPIGMIALDKREPGFYTEEHAQLALAFAAQAAVAVENARLYEQAQQEIAERKRTEEALKRRATQLATVGEVGQQITFLLELDPLLDHIVNLIREAFNYRYVSILLVDPATGEELVLGAGAGYELEPMEALRLKVGQEGICGWVAASGEPLLVGDVSQEPRYRLVEALSDTRSELTVPIHVKSRIIGVLDVQSAELDGFDEDDLSTLQTLADQVSVAIENAWLFEAEREQRELAEALEEAAAAVSSTLHLDQVLDRILEQVERVVPGDVFNVMLIEGDIARLVRCRGHKQPPNMDDQSSVITIAEYPSLVKMARTGKPVVIPDTAADPNWVPSKSQDSPRSYVAAPIRVAGLTVGFLNVSGAYPGQFGPADARRLEAFADHAATAIENARLYRELFNHAEQLEQRVQERTAQLQAQYARLDAILRSASDGIIVTDAGGEIIQANPIAQTWLTQTLSPEDGARLREAVRDLARQAGEQPSTVLELTGLDLELRAAPIAEPGMEEAAAVVAVHDVSHLKAMERAKSRFVSNVSHELRTPVTTIKLYAHLMQRTPPESEKWGQYLNALAQEANRQARLVEDILQISRIDTGRLEMVPRPTSLNELTEIALVSHQVLAQDRGLTLEHRPSLPAPGGAGESGPVALVDPERMMQVLNNLVRNSIHYTPEGGRVVIATGKAEAEGRVWATVTVTDTGMGIPEEELPHVFERFFRGEKPRLMQISGTGLGLAITKEIVELHGGRVTVESPSTLRRGFPRLCSGQAGQAALQAGEECVGSTFTVWLPITD